MTHRQFCVWRAWLDEQWNRPSRSDYYAMRVAQRCHQAIARHPHQITVDDQRIQFLRRDDKEPVKETVKESQGRWLNMVGMSPIRATISRERAAEIAALPLAEAVRVRRAIAEGKTY